MAANPSTKNAHQVLIQELLDNLPSGYTAASVALPNRPMTRPEGDKWLRPTVIVQDVNNVQADGLWLRYDGQLVIGQFYPVGGDTLAQLTEAETIAAIYQNNIIGDVNCEEALIEVNPTEENWYNVQIRVNFHYEGA